jgi:hypothetical protein
MIVGALLIALSLCFVAYSILQVAHAITVMTEQLSLGVRLTEQAAPSALAPEPPPVEGVVSWPSADGWVPTAVEPDIVDTKARTSDNNEAKLHAAIDQLQGILDEAPELRGKRGSVIDGR